MTLAITFATLFAALLIAALGTVIYARSVGELKKISFKEREAAFSYLLSSSVGFRLLRRHQLEYPHSRKVTVVVICYAASALMFGGTMGYWLIVALR